MSPDLRSASWSLPLQFALVSAFAISVILLRYYRTAALVWGWTAALVLAAGNITSLATMTRPARPEIVVAILVTWAITPPLFFVVEWNLMKTDFKGANNSP